MRLTNQITVVNKLNKKLLQSIDVLSLNKDDLLDYINKQYLNNPFIKIRYKNKNSYISDSYESIINEIPNTNTIEDDLIHQLNILRLNQEDLVLVKALIFMLDDNGYLRSPLQELSFNLGVSESKLNRALMILQSLEPAGIGSRSLAECLSVQLDRQGLLTNSLILLLNNLPSVKSLSKSQLAELCETTEANVIQMLSLLRRLNPNPIVKNTGDNYANDINTISPDVIVSINKSTNKIEVGLSNFDSPDVFFDSEYYQFVLKYSKPTDVKFLNECKEKAQELIYNLDTRSKTIVKIVNVIISKQNDFFYNNKLLKNLKQKEIANFLKLHESTVSRAICNKYLSFNNINYPIQDFFSGFVSSVPANTDVSIDLHDIGFYIKDIINNESKDNILSDFDISKKLNEEGIQISRRTVAKYRLKLDIPSSEQRRHMWTRYL